MATHVFEISSLNRYNISHKVRPHVDAALEPLKDKRTGRFFNRRTSFFVYVYASPDLEGGETFFPQIPPPDRTGFNSSLIESKDNALGAPALAVKPFTGSAIFWISLKPDGSPDPKTLHEGLPVRKGDKIGMNIWAKHYLD
jgi:prolyl 4-hydroxylase